MHRALLAPALALALALALAPTAAAHGTAEASELEVEVLFDEGNDANDARPGWDVNQVFVGEAHEHELAQGAAGDGVYWRADLYGVHGAAGPLAGGEWRAELTFESEAGAITRTIRTSDGQTFETDFDLLRVNASDGITRVERALVLLGPAGLAPGMTLTGFRVATFVDDEPRDVAPGGVPVAGPLVVPVGEEPPAAEYVLTGPVRYAGASVADAEGAPALRVTSLLKEGEQHLHAHLPPGVTSPDPLQAVVKPGETATFRLDLSGAPEGDASFDVTTDIGGRVSLTLAGAGDARTLDVAGDDAPAVPIGAAGEAQTPLAPWLALAGVALALAWRRR